MTVTQSIVLGAVQGLTEFLPVSSSGHLALFDTLVGLEAVPVLFTILVHVATLLAVILFFGKSLFTITFNRLVYIGLGTIPVFMVGFLLKSSLELIFDSTLLVGFALLFTAGLNFFGQWLLMHKTQVSKLTNLKAFNIGLAQTVALLPGVSRSGSTVVAGLGLGLNRDDAFAFSFQLAIPAIVAAAGYETWKSLHDGITFDWHYLPGFLAALLVGYLSLVILKRVITNAKLHYFGWYCLAVGLVVIISVLW